MLESEVTARQRTVQGVLDTGQELIDTGHPSKRKIKTRMESVREKMDQLREYVEGRKLRLQMAVESHQVCDLVTEDRCKVRGFDERIHFPKHL